MPESYSIDSWQDLKELAPQLEPGDELEIYLGGDGVVVATVVDIRPEP